MVGSDPYDAVTVLQQAANAVEDQSVRLSEFFRFDGADSADSLIGRDPYGSVAAFQEAANEVVRQF